MKSWTKPGSSAQAGHHRIFSYSVLKVVEISVKFYCSAFEYGKSIVFLRFLAQNIGFSVFLYNCVTLN